MASFRKVTVPPEMVVAIQALADKGHRSFDMQAIMMLQTALRMYRPRPQRQPAEHPPGPLLRIMTGGDDDTPSAA